MSIYFCFFPQAKIRWICSPRLKAWLKSSLVWNSEMNGNQASIAIGAKIMTPMRYSYPLARALIELHIPIPFTIGRHACAINKRAHPVGKKANKQTKMSPAVRCRNTKKTRVPMKPMNNKSFRSLNISWKSAPNFFLPMDTIFRMMTTATMTSHDRP